MKKLGALLKSVSSSVHGVWGVDRGSKRIYCTNCTNWASDLAPHCAAKSACGRGDGSSDFQKKNETRNWLMEFVWAAAGGVIFWVACKC